MSYALVRAALSLLARVYWRFDVRGREHVPPTGAVLVASNHLSFIDSLVIPMAMPRKVAFLAKQEYFTGHGPIGRVQALFFGALGAVPVNRGVTRDAVAALEVAQGVLARGEAFGIYPEGTRSRDGRLYRGRTGVAWLALSTRAVVVPVAVSGTDRAQPVGVRLPRPVRVGVRFGAPIDPNELADRVQAGLIGPGRARREFTDTVMAAIAALSDQTEAGVYNPSAAPEEAGA